MNEKALDGARTPNTFDTLSSITADVATGEVLFWAHVAPVDRVADALEVDLKYASPDSPRTAIQPR